MQPSQTLDMAGYVYRFEGAERVEGPNYDAIRGHLTLMDGEGRVVALLDPEKRSYNTRSMDTTEAAIHTTWLHDHYAVIGDPSPDKGPGAFVTRFYYEPFVPLLWYGALLMGLGGVVSLTDRRYRVGAPARRAAMAPGHVAASSGQPAAGGAMR
jgi:cytochrome c-type biogenesis protein CcmF